MFIDLFPKLRRKKLETGKNCQIRGIFLQKMPTITNVRCYDGRKDVSLQIYFLENEKKIYQQRQKCKPSREEACTIAYDAKGMIEVYTARRK